MTVWKSEPFWGNYFTLNNILVNGLQKKNEPHVWPDFLDSPDFFKRTVPFHFNCMARCVTSNDYMQWNIKTSEFDGESIKYQVTSPNPNYRIRDLDFLEYKEIGKRPIEKAYLEKERIKAHFIIILAINLANTYQYSEKWFSNSNLKTTAVGTGKTGIIIIYDQDHSRVLGYKTLEKELVLNN
jgi:DNA gyrase/topoisomerase IV subunit B